MIKILLTLLCLMMALTIHGRGALEELPLPKGPYLGQKPPGTAPQAFVPELFRMHRQIHGRLAFTPGGDEAIWCITSTLQKKILLRQGPDGFWQPPAQAILSDIYSEHEPCYSADGKRLYYQSRAPLHSSPAGQTGAQGPHGKDIDIWVRERLGDSWSEPRNLGAPVNSSEDDCQPWLAGDGSLYLMRQSRQTLAGVCGQGDIYYAPLLHGRHQEPRLLGPQINSEYEEGHAVVAPDGRYLLFTSNRPGGYSREFNLYLSFRQADGSWGPARCLSHRLAIENIWAPTLSHDGRYLFFCGGYPGRNFNEKNNYYWVDTRFIDEFRLEMEAPAAGGALVWYLGHCGYAVRTQSHLLVFDYQEKRDGPQPKSKPDRPTLDQGWIDAAQIKDLKVRVFTSHSHGDHYDPLILSWKDQVPDIAYFFGWKDDEIAAHHCLAGPKAEYKSPDLEISTINSNHAGVPEVAWLIKVDGLVIYHNGDCRPADPVAENRHLKRKIAAIDLAFVFLETGKNERYAIQNRDLFGRIAIKAAFPMHMTAGSPQYETFRRVMGAEFPAISFQAPAKLGQKFIYAKGKLSSAQ